MMSYTNLWWGHGGGMQRRIYLRAVLGCSPVQIFLTQVHLQRRIALADNVAGMEHDRLDIGYLHWQWQSWWCSLPPFESVAFLDLITDKHFAFVGDSMARNQLESLLCLLVVAEESNLVYCDGEENKFRRWVFRWRNAIVSVFWSPFLVKGMEKDELAELKNNTLFLETADDRWVAELDGIDIVLVFGGSQR